jgi:hypothetical protein
MNQLVPAPNNQETDSNPTQQRLEEPYSAATQVVLLLTVVAVVMTIYSLI